MPLAVLNLDIELSRLSKLMIALLQPVLLLALCCAFVLASVHLLTMLATRWGHRRVSSKAMFFSLTVHVMLVAGIVALVPETRRRIWAHLADLQTYEPVIVETVPEIAFNDNAGSGGAGGAMASKVRASSQATAPDLSRTDETVDPFTSSEPAVERPATETTLPDITPTAVLPPPVEVTPDKVAATETVLEEFAKASLPEPVLETTARPEVNAAAPELGRNETTSAEPVMTPQEVERPRNDAVSRVADATVPKAEPLPVSSEGTEAPMLHPDVTATTPEMAPVAADPVIPAPAPPQTPKGDSNGSMIARSAVSSPLPSLGPLEVTRPKTSMAPPVQPTFEKPRFEGPASPSISEQPTLAKIDTTGADPQLPATYQMRTPVLQEKAVQQFGGTEDSEAAVELSLKFLAGAQEPNGQWNVLKWNGGFVTRSPDGQVRDFGASDLDVGVTALSTLAFLGKLNTLSEGDYSENVRRSVKWLVSQQHPNGFIGLEAKDARTGTVPGNMAGMYGHGMATFALAEAYAMSRDLPEAKSLRRPIERAIGFILATQLEDGGWRYFQYQTEGGDMSLFGWQLMALKSAQVGGIPIPARTKEAMIGFLKKNAKGPHGGLAAYRGKEAVTPSMTAEALFCRQVLGVSHNSPSSQEAVAYLLANANLPSRQQMNFYYWYYGTLAMFQHGGEDWQKWNTRIRDLLVAEQEHTGEMAGSWPPRDPWSPYGGRIYTTAMSTLCLEVYYRYLPMYQQGTTAAPAPAEPGN